MKSKSDIQKIIVSLTVVTKERPDHTGAVATDDEKSKAKAVMDVLLWVLDYPNNFHKFAEPTLKMLPMSDDQLEKTFNEAVKDWEEDEAGTHSE